MFHTARGGTVVYLSRNRTVVVVCGVPCIMLKLVGFVYWPRHRTDRNRNGGVRLNNYKVSRKSSQCIRPFEQPCFRYFGRTLPLSFTRPRKRSPRIFRQKSRAFSSATCFGGILRTHIGNFVFRLSSRLLITTMTYFAYLYDT